MKDILEIGKQKWEIRLGADRQLSFAYAIPKHLSSWRNHPLWRNWDWRDTSDLEEEWSFDFEGVPAEVSPFRVKAALLSALTELVVRSRTRFFYFTPSTPQRGRVFSRLVPSILSRLGREWAYQASGDYWFYFFKHAG